jgi:hypothetical protein
MTTKTHLVTFTFEAPALWASAFVNADLTGLDFYGPDCVAEFEAWVEANPGKNVVECSDEPHIGRWNGLQTELLTYSYLVECPLVSMTDLAADPAASVRTLPADYEPCGMCGFDHAYEQAEAREWHFKKTEHSEE